MKRKHSEIENKYYCYDQYFNLKKIGQGGYGTVYSAKDFVTNKQVALKKIFLDEDDEGIPGTSLREISILKDLKHHNIVKLFDVFISHTRLFIVMELCDTDLSQLIQTEHWFVTRPDMIKYYLSQILSGIAYCHRRRVMHRDLKPQNLLVYRKKNLIKLADFGLAKAVSVPYECFTPGVVTLHYRAPEILLSADYYGAPVDIWSIGCIFAEMILGGIFFTGETEIDLLECIFKTLGTPNMNTWPGLNRHSFYQVFPVWKPRPFYEHIPNLEQNGIDVLNGLLGLDPVSRITARKALHMPYFDKVFVKRIR